MAREPFRIEGLEGVLKTLKALPPELVGKNGGPVRVALRKAALIILTEAQANVQGIIDTPNIGGDVAESSGLLKSNIVATRRRMPAGLKGERFAVRVRRKTYPEQGAGKKRTTAQIGALLEQGTERREPMPWMRPAFESKKREAVAVFERELPRAIDRIVKKLARQNGVA